MIPLFIFRLLRSFGDQHTTANKLLPLHAQIFFLILLQSIAAYGQEKIVRYNILHHGEVQGTMILRQQTIGKQVRLKAESEVTARLLMKVTVKSIEEAIFENGILVYSSLCRIVNGAEKINQQIKATGVSYKITEKDKTTTQNTYPINHSILFLYYQEPVNVAKIYSDSFKQFVGIEKIDSNKYRVEFPNGNVNYYSYRNGICTNVEVNQFYDIQFQLVD